MPARDRGTDQRPETDQRLRIQLWRVYLRGGGFWEDLRDCAQGPRGRRCSGAGRGTPSLRHHSLPTALPTAALFDALMRSPLEGLLDEPEEVDVKRKADIELLNKLRAAKRALEALA